MMRRYPESLSKSWGGWRERARAWLPQHAELRKAIVRQLKKGPLRLSEFEDHVRTKGPADGWGFGSDVSTMLFHLQMSGEVMVVGHEGNQNIWGLSEAFLPSSVERKPLPEDKVERKGAERALRALGTASPSEVTAHSLSGQHLKLKDTLKLL